MVKPSDQYIMSALYSFSKINQGLYYGLTVLGFLISSFVSIYNNSNSINKNNPNFILSTIILSASFILAGYFFQNKSKIRHSQAEKFRKQDFIKEVIDQAINVDHYIYYEIGNDIIKRAWKEKLDQEKGIPSNVDLSNPYVTVLIKYEEKVLECIQQNCFQTASNLSYYYDWLSRKIAPVIFLIFLFVIVALVFAMVNFSSHGFDISQVIIALISLYFTIDFHRFYSSFKTEAEQLKTLETEIGLIKNGANASKMMYYFSEYIAILEKKPSIPFWVYKENLHSLKQEWKIRIGAVH